MKLWIDDCRVPPQNGNWTTWAKTFDEAMRYIRVNWYDITDISFDHDLGHNCKTGYDILCVIEKECADGRYFTGNLHIHSANPVGRKNMEAVINSIFRLSIGRFET